MIDLALPMTYYVVVSTVYVIPCHVGLFRSAMMYDVTGTHLSRVVLF